MDKDLEKLNSKLETQNSKLEKQNKKLKKKNKAGGKIILFLLLIIVILAAVMFFLDPFGWGIGPNAKGNGGSGAAEAPAQTTEAAETTAQQPTQVYIDVTVSGATIMFGSAESTADDVIKAAKDIGGDVIVNIHDDNATKNAMDALTAALDAEKIAFFIV